MQCTDLPAVTAQGHAWKETPWAFWLWSRLGWTLCSGNASGTHWGSLERHLCSWLGRFQGPPSHLGSNAPLSPCSSPACVFPLSVLPDLRHWRQHHLVPTPRLLNRYLWRWGSPGIGYTEVWEVLCLSSFWDHELSSPWGNISNAGRFLTNPCFLYVELVISGAAQGFRSLRRVVLCLF